VDQLTSSRFQWTVLQLARIKNLRVIRDESVRALLTDVPNTLSETYSRILSEIDPAFERQAASMLNWLAMAYRPLFIEELQKVCEVVEEDDIETASTKTTDPWPVRDIVALLPSLIELDPWPDFRDWDSLPKKRCRVILAHFSIKEFLLLDAGKEARLQKFALQPAIAHENLSASCLSYLLRNNQLNSAAQNAHLLEYAWNYWSSHALSKSAEPHQVHEEEVINLFADVSYRGQINCLGDRLLRRLKVFKMADVKDRLMVPAFLPQIKPYDITRAPFEPSNPFIALNVISTISHSDGSDLLLLQLSSSPNKFTEIQCWPIYRSFANAEPYIAISWAWSTPSGHSTTDNIIRIQGVPVECQHSLVHNLRNIRHTEGEAVRPVWIDGLCVDQRDYQKRAATLETLAKIFAQAETVVVILGDANPGDDIGIAAMQELARVVNLRVEGERVDASRLAMLWNQYPHDTYAFLRDVFSRTWWKRLWVLQEFLLPSRVSFLLDSLVFTSDVIETLVFNRDTVRQILGEVTTNEPSMWLDSDSWTAVCEITLLRRALQRGQKLNMARLLYVARKRTCEKERDRLPSLRSMASDASKFPTDYRLSLPSLLKEVTKNCIRLHQNVDHFSWIRTAAFSDLPSWALQNFRFDLGKRVPLVAGYFVDQTPDSTHFCASGDLKTELLDIGDAIDDTITLEALTVSRIRALEDLEGSCIDIQNSFGVDESTFWSTFAAGRQLARLRSGNIGVVPDEARVRDEVVILKGGKVPYVLRPLLMAPNTYELIGDW
jgi:hypothetical protein